MRPGAHGLKAHLTNYSIQKKTQAFVRENDEITIPSEREDDVSDDDDPGVPGTPPRVVSSVLQNIGGTDKHLARMRNKKSELWRPKHVESKVTSSTPPRPFMTSRHLDNSKRIEPEWWNTVAADEKSGTR